MGDPSSNPILAPPILPPPPPPPPPPAKPTRTRTKNAEPHPEPSSKEFAARKALPPWLVSLIVHLTLILILVLIPLHGALTTGLSLTGVFGDGDAEFGFDIGLPDDSQDTTTNSELQLGALSPTVTFPAALVTEQPRMSSLSGQLGSALQRGVAGRSSGMKSSLLRAFGGTNDTEAAVELGLKWLVKQQKSDGSWSLIGPYSDGGVSENRAAATAMALLAFLGSGHTHRSGEYRSHVDLGMRYLLKKQDSQGWFAQDAPDRQKMYAQAQCSIALSELLAMTQDQDLLPSVRLATVFAEQSQSPLGGWRYYPREDADVSVTGWFVMALISAQMAGVSANSGSLNKVHQFLDTVQHQKGSQYSYLEYEEPTQAMTAEALLCRQYLGWERHDPRLVRGCEYLLEAPIQADRPRRPYYQWYYATQVLHHMGGQPWNQWNEAMRVAIPAMQEKSGKERGSWSPKEDSYGVSGGRLYSTCMAIYCLEVYYRHLPLYGF
jgi:hypothetical protein